MPDQNPDLDLTALRAVAQAGVELGYWFSEDFLEAVCDFTHDAAMHVETFSPSTTTAMIDVVTAAQKMTTAFMAWIDADGIASDLLAQVALHNAEAVSNILILAQVVNERSPDA